MGQPNPWTTLGGIAVGQTVLEPSITSSVLEGQVKVTFMITSQLRQHCVVGLTC